jgi:hypothetical protein
MQHVELQILLLLNYGGLRNLDSQSGYQTKSKFVIHAKLNHSLLRDVYYGAKNYL